MQQLFKVLFLIVKNFQICHAQNCCCAGADFAVEFGELVNKMAKILLLARANVPKWMEKNLFSTNPKTEHF